MEKIQILNGNELIVRGALEAGFSLYTGYPGSPLADYFNILFKQRDELQEKGIKVVLANSEANAAAMASGAKQAGRDCIVAMKSMGLHVAADALSVGNFANPGPVNPENGKKPGVVVVVGDDPWSLSTSTAADSRYLYKHLHIPFFEPSTPQELKDWIKHALDLSQQSSLYCGLLLTTYMAEGGGRVELFDEKAVPKELEKIDTSSFNLSENVMVPPNSLNADVKMISERFPKVKKILANLDLDRVIGEFTDKKVGFLTSGSVYEVLKQVLEEHNLLDHFPVYKVACAYPLVDEKLAPYLSKLDKVIVVEEKRGFLENQLDELIQYNNLNIKVFGKQFQFDDKTLEGFPAYGGLNYEIVSAKLRELFDLLNINPCHWENSETLSWENPLPKRLPTFCPGCPHRETLSLLKDVRKILKNDGLDLVSHGDVGCYSLSFLPPFKEMHNLSAMGQGGALGAGMDMFTENPSVVLMGDSTFFHSGLTDISNSVQCGHNITYILLDNDNTAMTGHQMTPRSGVSVDGRVRPKQDMIKLVRALGVTDSVEVNPSDRYFYKNLMLDMVRRPGVKVIISNKECGLTYHSRLKQKEKIAFNRGDVLPSKTFYNINTSSCEDCRECINMTGCPGLTQVFDAYGSKVAIDPQICVSDGYCTKIKACPSFEQIDVVNYHPIQYKKTKSVEDIKDLPTPDPVKSFESISQGNDWRCVVTGVGGSGVTTISRVLAEAAVKMGDREDLDFKFVDQKGLAQRNGNVTGHMAIYKKGKSYAVPTPTGTADIYLSPDLLDGSQHIHFLNKDGIAIFDKMFQVPLTILMDNSEENEALTQEELIKRLGDKLGDRVHLFSFKEISENLFGKSVYSSSMILGAAFQAGRLPFSLENIEAAFKKTMKKGELDNNLKAFSLGRYFFHVGEEKAVDELDIEDSSLETLKLLEKSIKKSVSAIESKSSIVKKYHTNCEKLLEKFPSVKKEYIHQYVHDLMLYDRGSKFKKFLKECNKIKEKNLTEKNTAHALRILARTYFIKDEVFVSHLMISPLEKERRNKRFSQLGESYFVTNINRPSFDFLGKSIEFDISPKYWMLAFMRHMRILRYLLVGWHSKERKIAKQVRSRLLEIIENTAADNIRRELQKIENVKGYRNIRYDKAEDKLEALH